MPVLRNLDAAYLGADPIDRIYCGATLAWWTTAYPQTVLADNPTGYWRMRDASGPDAADSSGNDNPATYHGTFNYGRGSPTGMAVDNGNKAGNLILPVVPVRTVEFAIEISAVYNTTRIQYLLDFRTGMPSGYVANAANSGWTFYLNGVYFGRATNANISELPVGEWFHIVLIGPTANTTTPGRILGRYSDGERTPAAISEVSVYGEVLTAEQVEDHYSAWIGQP